MAKHELSSALADNDALQEMLSADGVREELFDRYRRRAAQPKAAKGERALVAIAACRLSHPVTKSQNEIAEEFGISRGRVTELEWHIRRDVGDIYRRRR